MNGKQHETINRYALLPAVFLLGNYQIGYILSGLFVAKWLWNTYLFTPDLDTNSRSRKRLGSLGWIIDKIFGHRKTLHNPLFWIVLFGIEYYIFGLWALGGVFPVASHLIVDKF